MAHRIYWQGSVHDIKKTKRAAPGADMIPIREKPKVLVVDDERMVADTLATILKINGFDTTALYSGEQAIEWVESFHPHIVLSDICMHKISGIDTAEHIRQLHPECRVILFTTSTISPENRNRINKLGFEFLERPLHPEVLLAHLQK